MLIFLIMIFLIFYSILVNPSLFFSDIIHTMTIWLYHTYPSIFVFYLMADSLLKSNVLSKVTFILKPFFKFQTAKAYEIFIISMLIGNPGTSSLVNQELKNGFISEIDANKLLRLSIFMNPLFLISLLSIKEVFIVIICQLIICFIINLFIKSPKYEKSIKLEFNFSYLNFMSSVTKVIEMLLMIASIMIIANIIKFSIVSFIQMFNIQNEIFSIITKLLFSIIEVSTGILDIKTLGLSQAIILPIIAGLITFQGISINMQIYNTLDKSLFSFKKIISTKIIASILMLVLVSLVSFIFGI